MLRHFSWVACVLRERNPGSSELEADPPTVPWQNEQRLAFCRLRGRPESLCYRSHFPTGCSQRVEKTVILDFAQGAQLKRQQQFSTADSQECLPFVNEWLSQEWWAGLQDDAHNPVRTDARWVWPAWESGCPGIRRTFTVSYNCFQSDPRWPMGTAHCTSRKAVNASKRP